MSLSISIPILYHNRSTELTVALTYREDIYAIESVIDNKTVDFLRNEKGCFEAVTNNCIDEEYLHCIEQQINRMFN